MKGGDGGGVGVGRRVGVDVGAKSGNNVPTILPPRDFLENRVALAQISVGPNKQCANDAPRDMLSASASVVPSNGRAQAIR
jgi:hypothetical protein